MPNNSSNNMEFATNANVMQFGIGTKGKAAPKKVDEWIITKFHEAGDKAEKVDNSRLFDGGRIGFIFENYRHMSERIGLKIIHTLGSPRFVLSKINTSITTGGETRDEETPIMQYLPHTDYGFIADACAVNNNDGGPSAPFTGEVRKLLAEIKTFIDSCPDASKRQKYVNFIQPSINGILEATS